MAEGAKKAYEGQGWERPKNWDRVYGDVLSWPTATPTPSPRPTVTPKIEAVKTTTPVTPTLTPTSTAKPTPIPSYIKEIPYEQRPYFNEIKDAWGDDFGVAHEILRYINEAGVVKGENTGYIAGKGWENEETGERGDYNYKTEKYIKPDGTEGDKYILDENGNKIPKYITNALTGEKEISEDRGLFRINNNTFYDFQNRFGDRVEELGLYDYKDMYDPTKNAKMAKLVYDIQKEAWYGASPKSGARL